MSQVMCSTINNGGLKFVCMKIAMTFTLSQVYPCVLSLDDDIRLFEYARLE